MTHERLPSLLLYPGFKQTSIECMTQVMKSETQRLTHEQNHMNEKIKDNTDKIENNRQLPYLVGTALYVLFPNIRQRH